MANSEIRATVKTLVQHRIKNQDKRALLWQSLLFVKENPNIKKLQPSQIELQEQKFELVHTEASYNLRLELLREHFYENTQLKDDILKKMEYKILFSNIKEIKACSDRFLADLEKIWQEDIYLKDIFDVVLEHCSTFSPYARYCKDQGASIALLMEKMANDVIFAKLVNERSERIKAMCSISFADMLGLPRIRLPSMIPSLERALSKIDSKDVEYESCRQALSAMKQLANECNETIRRDEDIQMLLELRTTLNYPEDMPVFPLVGTGRCLDTKDVFTHHEKISVNTSEKPKAHPELTVMLFNDLVLILEQTSRSSSSDGKVMVKDYCRRHRTDVIGIHLESSEADSTYAMLLRMKENSKKQEVDMLLSTKKKATRDWWVSRFSPPPESRPLAQIPPHVPARSTLDNPSTTPLPSEPASTRPSTVADVGGTSRQTIKAASVATPSLPALKATTSGTSGNSYVRGSRISRFADDGGYVKNPDFVPINAKDERHIVKSKSSIQFNMSPVRETSVVSVQPSQNPSSSLEEVAKKPERVPAPTPEPVACKRPNTFSEDTTGEWSTEKLTELMELNKQIDYAKEVGNFPLLSSSRRLIKTGVLTQYPQPTKGLSLFKAKPFKCEFLLFNDILLLSKAKKDNRYLIINYCKRNLVKISKAEASPHLLGKNKAESGVIFLLIVTFIENHEKKRDDLVFSCDDNRETDVWVDLFEPPKASATGEEIFYPWDCPTVRIVRSYEALTHVEMSVNVDDEIQVIRKCSNGMYEGERLGDHRKGLFPASVTKELASTEYARAKALREKFDRETVPVDSLADNKALVAKRNG